MQDLTRLARQVAPYMAARTIPGLASIAVIPLALNGLGPEQYGVFSLYLATTLLVAGVGGAIVVQPVYRFLAVHADDEAAFRSIAVVLAVLAGGLTALCMLWQQAGILPVLAFSALATLFVAYSFTSVVSQVHGRRRTFIQMEFVRAGVLLALLIMPGVVADVSTLAAATACSYLVATLVAFPSLSLAMPTPGWMRKMVAYGAVSSLWTLIVGLPLPLLRALVLRWLSPSDAGLITALFDLLYRLCALVSSSIGASIFPIMAKMHDAGSNAAVRMLLRLSILAYVSASVAVCALSLFFYIAFSADGASSLSVTWQLTASVFATAVSVQAMSLCHKMYEMNLNTWRMVLIVCAALSPFAAFFLNVRLGELEYPVEYPFILLSICATAYSIVVLFSSAPDRRHAQ